MTIHLGVVMDPIESIHYKKDSTLAMLWAASDRGWQISYMRQQDLYLDKGQARATATPLQVFRDPEHYYDLGDSQDIALAELDVILMRKDPPFDNEFLYSTYILEAAERQGALVVNKPQSLRDHNEKLFATEFPECCPPLVVSRDPARLRAFHQQHQDVIFKPLDGMGGSSIFRVKADDPNLAVILETLTNFGQSTIMAQQFIPDISNGDKRVLLINGEPVPYCLARIPAKGETRGNIAAGGTGRAQPLSDRDRWIAAQVGPIAKERGLLLVGLDIIGDYLTEVNVTSPTCLREIDNEYQTDIAAMLMDEIQQLLAQR
ncbi:glutathione synthase [Dasania sp. GY-MA-18]|uniref:Glutathione synthetase n=1 Tax=Dasania phycosphaerae TaxID=2950436 RepID=A0A9J6RK14_9GAMM|nr:MULTISPECIES: glutathione synthase [Dasania]MCR8922140.1 glutathione synthase [Dasania sp. GY-MA-18]MCZ0864568.1 glutathione synthase [Dasania phycosphaerae]MCZ0868296.1 glutathione synthase [Dasania phycosphaerae]